MVAGDITDNLGRGERAGNSIWGYVACKEVGASDRDRGGPEEGLDQGHVQAAPSDGRRMWTPSYSGKGQRRGRDFLEEESSVVTLVPRADASAHRPHRQGGPGRSSPETSFGQSLLPPHSQQRRPGKGGDVAGGRVPGRCPRPSDLLLPFQTRSLSPSSLGPAALCSAERPSFPVQPCHGR